MLQYGDVLVCDNASIHKANGIRDVLLGVLNLYGVRLVYTPTYSPELNPCEMLFAQSKRYMRDHRGNHSFITEILYSFASINLENVFSYYYQCQELFDR